MIMCVIKSNWNAKGGKGAMQLFKDLAKHIRLAKLAVMLKVHAQFS